jgi:hypothetical protein
MPEAADNLRKGTMKEAFVLEQVDWRSGAGDRALEAMQDYPRLL